MPREPELREAEVCSSEADTKLSQCPESGERGRTHLIVVARRAVSSLPWDVELARCTREEKESSCLKTGIPNAEEKAKGNTTCYKSGAKGPVNYTEIPAGCIKINEIYPEIPIELVFYGSQEVYGINGVKNGLSASKLKFIEAGSLSSPEGAAGEFSFTGELKVVGAESVQLLQAR
jgi:hypothetical protein